MAGGGGAAAAAGDRSLRDTPTWAVALVCAVLLILSILIEHGIHSLSKVRLLYNYIIVRIIIKDQIARTNNLILYV